MRSLVCSSLVASLALLADADSVRRLTFQQRVLAQAAIERVQYAHQVGATRPFEEAVPAEVIAGKVLTYLRQSAALERLWARPIDSDALRIEYERIRRSSRLPGRLREIEQALGDDAVLIQETFVRAALADRLVGDRYAFDVELHAGARREVDRLRQDLLEGSARPTDPHPARIVLDLIASPGGVGTARGALALRLAPGEFARWRAAAPARIGDIGPLVERRDAFSFSTVLQEEPGRARVATWRVPKLPRDAWWRGVEARFDPTAVEPVAREAAESLPARPAIDTVPEASSVAARGPSPGICPAQDVWTAVSSQGAPAGGTAVWSGHEMIVWQAEGAGRYLPDRDEWSSCSMQQHPQERVGESVVWTGNVMTVWGGLGASGYLGDGARYDPVIDAWSPTASLEAPEARFLHATVWTGSEMVVWGGGSFESGIDAFVGLDSGARYDPVSDRWQSIPQAGAAPGGLGQSAAWTGHEVIVWGGHDGVAIYLDSGAALDPALGTWRGLSRSGAPAGRWRHSAIWTGQEMLIWGGDDGLAPLDSGARYDPRADTWRPMSQSGAPEPRWGSSSVWSGRSLIVWGGQRADQSAWLDTGARYDLAQDLWEPTSMQGAPEARAGHTAVWTGSEMIVWGGSGGAALATGGRYSIDSLTDADADGSYSCGGDCDDADPLVHAGAVELPGNLTDEDCDGSLGPCDPHLTWTSRARFAQCVARECRSLVSSGRISRPECRALVKQARESQVGLPY